MSVVCAHALTYMYTCNHAAYCRNNCPQPTLSGCDKCTVGYKPRDCCQCEDGYFDKQGICTSEYQNIIVRDAWQVYNYLFQCSYFRTRL